MWPSRASSIAFFVALLASALLLGPALAHTFELPTKITLPREEYFVVQQIYRGWAGFSVVLFVQVIALLTAAILARRERRVLVPTVLAILLVLGAQVLFWPIPIRQTKRPRTGRCSPTIGSGCGKCGNTRISRALACSSLP